MKIPWSPLVLAALWLHPAGAHAQGAAQEFRRAALDAELAAIVQNPQRPLASLSVLALRDGELLYQAQFGSQWIDNANPARSRSADAQTLYRIASISKTITTLGVMKLVEQGRLQLDRDVSDYLGYRLRNPHFPQDPITLRMLLSHRSSLRDDAGYYWDALQNVHLREVLVPGGRLHGSGAMWAANAGPGAFFSYANLPWGVIGSVMESVTGERFDRLMRRLILDPMGLQGGFHPADFSAGELSHLATLYRKRNEVAGREVWDSAGPWVAQVDDYSLQPPAPRAGADYVPGSNGTLFGPQGNCRLSAQALGQIALMLLNRGQHQGRQILRPETVDEMLATQWQANRQPGSLSNGDDGASRFQSWALGLQRFVDFSENGKGDRLVQGGGFTGVGHFGDAWGLTALMVLDPVTRDAMVFLSGGPGFDPESEPGRYSSQHRYEEQILSALHRHALRRDAGAAAVP